MRFFKPKTGSASLPSLSKPAVARNIKEGLEAINGAGQKIVGNLHMDDVRTFRGAVLPMEVMQDADNPSNPEFFMLSQSAGDAVAADLAKGKEAVTDDGKIVGTVDVETGTKVFPSYVSATTIDIPDGSPAGSHKALEFSVGLKTPVLFRANSGVAMQYDLTPFGDALAMDVRKGKTFTSKDGFIKTGTLEVSGFDTTQYMDTKVLGYDELNVLDNMSIIGIPDWKLCYIKKVGDSVGSFYTPETLVSYTVGGDQLQFWVDIGFTSSSIQFTAKTGQSFKMRQLFTNIIVFFPAPAAPTE